MSGDAHPKGERRAGKADGEGGSASRASQVEDEGFLSNTVNGCDLHRTV